MEGNDAQPLRQLPLDVWVNIFRDHFKPGLFSKRRLSRDKVKLQIKRFRAKQKVNKEGKGPGLMLGEGL